MRSILEQAVIHHLNGDADKAQEFFHRFIVARAQQIHESMRNGETVAEGFEDEDVVNEEFFSEDDLAKLDRPVEDEGVEDDEDADEFGDAAPMGDDDGADDFGGDKDGEDEFGADKDEAPEGDIETRIEDLEAELERLAAEFESMQGEDGEGDEFNDDVDAANDLDDDMTNDDETSAEGDDEFDAPAEDEHAVHESDDGESDDDFDDLAESVVSELEKINVKMADAKTVANGETFTQNNKSNLPQKKVGQRDGAGPIHRKDANHKGYERETAPGVTTLKKRKNNVDHATSALSPVAKTDKGEHKGVGTGKTGNITAKSPKSPVMPSKGVQK